MDAGKLARLGLGVGLVVAAVLGWRALARPATGPTTQPAARARGPQTAARVPSPPARAGLADSGVGAIMPCAHGLFSVPVGTELRYHLEVGDGSDSQCAEYLLRLMSTRAEARERVDSWQVTLRVPGVEEPVESNFERRCSDAEGAQEPWMGVDFAGLSELLSQGWRWPAHLQPGLTFGGELRRQVMDQTLRVERMHRVIGRESIRTPAGSFEAWRVELTDRTTPDAEPAQGTAWVVEGLGLVRLSQPTAAGPFSLELVERNAS